MMINSLPEESPRPTDEPRRFVAKKKNQQAGGCCGDTTNSPSEKSSNCCAQSLAMTTTTTKKKPTRRRVIKSNQIPAEIEHDPKLIEAMKALPWNYNFEIKKTVWRIQRAKAACVALQFPEGLLLYSCVIADIVTQFTGARTIILGDVTYGACCVDDLTAKALGADFLVHYGHSCLVPIDVTSIQMLYVFVTIAIDSQHLVDCMKLSFSADTKLTLMGTIQFTTDIHSCLPQLKEFFSSIDIPQAKPLSPGEVLGCTSPILKGRDVLVFVADGRFHLESAMIANPELKAYRYDPYAKVLSREKYDVDEMKATRQQAIEQATGAEVWGVILGTLGRQGNTSILNHVITLLESKGKKYFILLLSEIFPDKLAQMQNVDAWVQIACPRLSIDWGSFFAKPLLSSYELEVCLDTTAWKETYPMDYYAKEGGSWANYNTNRTMDNKPQVMQK